MAGFADKLAAWDGKAVAPIEKTYAQHQSDETFLADVVRLSADEACGRGATWLLKRHLEAGGALTAPLTRKLFATLDALAHWEARLHVLQSLPFLTIAARDAGKVAAFVRTCLEDEATFVRAWAYTGLHHLAVQHAAYRDEAAAALEAALKAGQPPSVKVRIRRALDAGF